MATRENSTAVEREPRSSRLPRMVGWYDPTQLLGTVQQVLVSTLVGRHADHRLMEALQAHGSRSYDCSEPGADGELWIDYVADAGDGWDSTYAVAHAVAQRSLRVRDASGSEHATRSAHVLVLGGYEVYPTPTRDAYARRLVQPYETALRETPPPHPRVFAIPGNHDWYDSLVSFTRLFAGTWFGGWKSEQERSDFALKLPHGWWLLGTDLQLGSDIDEPQVKVTADALTIYPIGLRRVPRRWKRREGDAGPELVPDDPRATHPELIEPPIVVPRRRARTPESRTQGRGVLGTVPS